MSQKNDILAALQQGQHLTPLNALIRVHTMSLSQRIGQLKRAGYPIQTKIVKIGPNKRVAEYWLELNPAAGVPTPQGSDRSSSTYPPSCALDLTI